MTVPVEVLDAAGLDAEMRAIAERATAGAEMRAAQPSVGLDPMEADATDIPQTDSSDIWMDPIPEVPAGGGGGGGEGGADTDDVSINKIPHDDSQGADNTDEGKIQIKDWKAGTNAATQDRDFSLAEVLTFGPEANLSRGDKMIVRGDPTYNGGAADLAYRAVGQLPFDGMSVEGTYVNQEPKIQIKDFDTAAATEVTLSSTATADKFLVKSVGGNVEYRTLKAPAGGGGGADISALNGVTLVTGVEWIGSPTYAIRVTKRTCTVANNVLTLGNAQTMDIQTTPLSGE